MFKCIVCGATQMTETSHKPRDRKECTIVDCKICGHRQMYPLLSEDELQEEYDEDKTVHAMTQASDMEAMRTKFSEWTKIHADMYWEKLQRHSKVLNLGSGYGFLEEELNKREKKNFIIEGVEIGKYRLDNYVGGTVHTINFLTEEIPDDMKQKYDLVMALHLLEHINEPVKYLKNIKPLLRENGEIIIEVPNLNSYLCELSPEYKEFFYLYEHVSYFTAETLSCVLEKAGYTVENVYSKEVYSIENHINWIRTGKPFTKYNQMYLPDERIEFINEEYKKVISDMGKGYSLIAEAKVKA